MKCKYEKASKMLMNQGSLNLNTEKDMFRTQVYSWEREQYMSQF